MKSTIFSIAFALAAITAVSAEVVPQCIESCATPFIAATGCEESDLGCLCENQEFLGAIEPCISKCSPQDQQAAVVLCAPTTGGPTPALSTRPASVTRTVASSATSGSVNPTTIPACFGTCIYGTILSTLSGCTSNDFKCMCKSAGFLTQLGKCPPSNCAGVDEKTTVAQIAAACGAPVSSEAHHISTTAIKNTTIPINTGVYNSTAVNTATNNFTRTSTTSASDSTSTDSTSTSESETTTNTDASSTSDPSPSPSQGGADRLVGSGLVAAAIGMAFFVL